MAEYAEQTNNVAADADEKPQTYGVELANAKKLRHHVAMLAPDGEEVTITLKVRLQCSLGTGTEVNRHGLQSAS